MEQIHNKEEIEIKNRRCIELQKKYSFSIPKYILVELIKPIYNKLEVALLINMAVMNNRFTIEEGMILKNKYCFNK